MQLCSLTNCKLDYFLFGSKLRISNWGHIKSKAWGLNDRVKPLVGTDEALKWGYALPTTIAEMHLRSD